MLKDLKVQQVLRVFKDHKVSLMLLVFKVLQVFRVVQDLQDFKVFKDPLVRQEFKHQLVVLELQVFLV